MKCILDIREHKLIELFGDKVETKALDIGDIFITDGSYELLIERKTWGDLHSSIMDSRFREQRSRLQQWRSEQQKFIYIVEGQYTEEYKMEKRTLERLMIAYDIPVFFTMSIHYTFAQISNWLSLESLEKLFVKRSIEDDQIESRLHGTLKKNYKNSELFFMEILCSLKGITVSMAKGIQSEFKSIHSFITSYNENQEDWMKRIQSITYKTPKNNDKKLSPKVIECIQHNFGVSV